MKKIILIILLTFFGSQFVNAGSYQRWIYWISDPNHVANATEMAKIISAIDQKMIAPNALCQVDGTTFKIPQPDMYLKYICMCVRISDPNVNTTQDVIKDIQGGQVVQWGNDISCKVKNYWTDSNGQISFTPNYSGAELGVWVLLINSIPTIKLDCGNPLEVYGGNIAYNPKPVDAPLPSAPTSPCSNCGTTNNYYNYNYNSNNVNSFNTTTSTSDVREDEGFTYTAPNMNRGYPSYSETPVYISRPSSGYCGEYRQQTNHYCAPRVEQNCNRPERNEYTAPRRQEVQGGPGGAGMIYSGNPGGSGMIRSTGGNPGGSGTNGSGNPGGAGMARRR